jgi:hypothetical protein
MPKWLCMMCVRCTQPNALDKCRVQSEDTVSTLAHLTSSGKAFLNSDRSTRLSSLFWLQSAIQLDQVRRGYETRHSYSQSSKHSSAHPVSMSWKMENSSKYCFRYTCKPAPPTCHSNQTPPSLLPAQASCICQWFNNVKMKSCNRTRTVQLTSSSLNSLLDT